MTDQNTNEYPEKIKKHFRTVYQQTPLIVRSPGRVNLIGEHTDYNMGFVLPAAINKAVYLGIQKREDNEMHFVSFDMDDFYQTDLQNITHSGKLWPDYILGVVEQFQKAGAQFTGFNIVFGGDIPFGAGLSSSAALECASGFAFNELFDFGFDKWQIALMGQAAENQFVGVNCGIMDQFASVFGKKQNLMQLDCRSLEYTYIPFNDEGIEIVLFDTRVKHSLASSAYNDRRAQCEKGVNLISQHHPHVKSLRDATEEMLLNHVKPVDEEIYRRCHYVVSEIQRLLDGCEDLKKDDLESFGKRMFETHAGLRDQYEVSCPELDHLVDLVTGNPSVLGARMMGGGFGGCTINLVKREGVQDLIEEITAGYKALTGKDVEVYLARIEDGTSKL
ncbi:galactokinase [Flavihumibacter sp. R14]|nr:galactokinase [Flavihumibacter soli]